MLNLSAEALRDTMNFLSNRLKEWKKDEAMRLELLARGFEEKLAELYEEWKQGECSFGYMAEQLGISTWDLYDILARRGLRTTNL
jgi:predicted HTH domain antitoxin